MAPRLKESSVHICEDSQSVGYIVLSQRKACGNVCFFTKKVLKHAQQVCSPLTCHFQFPCIKHKQEEQKPSAGYISEFVHISTSARMCFVQSTRVWFRAEILGKVFYKTIPETAWVKALLLASEPFWNWNQGGGGRHLAQVRGTLVKNRMYCHSFCPPSQSVQRMFAGASLKSDDVHVGAFIITHIICTECVSFWFWIPLKKHYNMNEINCTGTDCGWLPTADDQDKGGSSVTRSSSGFCVCARACVCDLLRILLRKSSQVCTLTRIQCCIRSHADPTSAGTSGACITAHMLAPRAPGENSLCFAFHCFNAFIFRGAYSTVTHIDIDCMAPNTIFLHLKPSEDIFMVFYRDEHH